MTNSPHRKVTIRDVADFVGVHHSTVSRALNPGSRARISPKMVEKISRVAEKMGYTPNIAASTLKQNRSFALGVLVPDLTNPVFPPIIRGIQNAVEEAGYTVLVANTDDDPQEEQKALRMMMSRSVDGLFVATARRVDPIVDECIEKQVPFVLVNRNTDKDGVNGVVLDEAEGMRISLDHLLELGHKHIAHIAGPDFSSTGHERARAFSSYMRACGLDDSALEMTAKYTPEEGRLALNRLLARTTNFTAIIAGNDVIALGCLDALADSGIRCPEDMSLVGVNDIPFLSRMSPPLTTLSVPKFEMGTQASRILLDVIDDPSREPVLLRMQPKLIVRGSTGPVVLS